MACFQFNAKASFWFGHRNEVIYGGALLYEEVDSLTATATARLAQLQGAPVTNSARQAH